MPNYQKRIVYLSDAQRQELFTNGSITVNGVTIEYDENDMYVTPQEEPVTDVQVNGTSVVTNGVANVPVASDSVLGAVKVSTNASYGVVIGSDGKLRSGVSSEAQVKTGAHANGVISPVRQHIATFYGLAKAAGHDEALSTEPLGTYTDSAKQAIQSMLGTNSMLAPVESAATASQAYAIGAVFAHDGKLYKATAAIAANDAFAVGVNCEETSVSGTFVKNTDYATSSTAGIVKIISGGNGGISLNSSNALIISPATDTEIKTGTNQYKPLAPLRQDAATFYGLAKAAGDTTMSSSNNAVGTYTTEALSAIHTMLGIDPAAIAALVEIPLVETVTGTAVTITGQPNTRYNCGELTSLSITPPASGSVDVIFSSGSTATVLTLPNTVKMPDWFDATSLETNTTYEILITDGVYGSVMAWAS